MKLLIDIGNTRMKWVFAHGSIWRPEVVVHRGQDPAALFERTFGNKQAPESVWVSCVAGDNVRQALTPWCEAQWKRTPIYVQSRASFMDVRNGYSAPESLGVDRWMALLAARKAVSGAACVVDAGTAVTVDALAKDGEFLGGVILPGVTLMRVALSRGTAGLAAGEGSPATCQARNTADALAAGALFGVCGAIERAVAEHTAALGGEAAVVLTGGDAERLRERLKLRVTLVPDLVLRGVSRVADSSPAT